MSEETVSSSHQQLGAFLRTRRESLDYRRLGLTRYGRTRTPGLRREEVAQLAEIGVTWYTKLEQGRPIKVSAKTLQAIAAALQCTPDETQHMFILAGLEEKQSKTSACETLAPGMQEILDQLHPCPAFILNARFDLLGFNRAYSSLMGVNFTDIEPADRNCIYLALTHPEWCSRMLDRDELLPRMVAMFRSAMTGHEQDQQWLQQLQRYMDASPVFQEIWLRYQVQGIENLFKRFRHPELGEFTLHQTNWWSASKSGNRMVVYMPADDHAREVLKQLPGASAATGLALPQRLNEA